MNRKEWFTLLCYAVLIILIPDEMWVWTGLAIGACVIHMYWLFSQPPVNNLPSEPITAEMLEGLMWDAEVTLNEPNSGD